MSALELLAHRTSQAAAGLCRAGWAYDYPTPDNLLFPLLHSSCTSPDAEGTAHGDNEGRYVNTEFDRALLSARAAADEAERIGWWQTAERLAMEDMALIPLWFRTEYRVFAHDAFTAMDLDFFGNPNIAELRPVDSADGAAAPRASRASDRLSVVTPSQT
jgi:oligopeptide transport system substrate-binding protein